MGTITRRMKSFNSGVRTDRCIDSCLLQTCCDDFSLNLALGKIDSLGLFNRRYCDAADSHHSQNPTLNRGDLSLVRRQRRMKESSEEAIPVGSLEPCRCGVGGLFVPSPVVLWKAS
jgi:hypothetical protein